MSPDGLNDTEIERILASSRTVAVVGAAVNPVRPSHIVIRYLIGKRYRVFGVNPGHAGETILGAPVFARLADIPEPIDIVDIFRRQDALAGVVDEALALPTLPKVIWMQLGLADTAAAGKARAAGLAVVMDRCIKIEYGRLCGEISWSGVNSRRLTARRPRLGAGFQHLELDAGEGGKD